jgi:uncharacterized protein GlcG (DUF336 family)
MQLVQAAHTEAESIDLAITAVVVDESGRLVALGRMDGARPISVDIAMNKAYTAASFKQPTDELKGIAGQAWFQSLIVSSNGKVTAGGGAIPIVDQGQVVGAVAVAGGTDEQDHRCAEVALRSFG